MNDSTSCRFWPEGVLRFALALGYLLWLGAIVIRADTHYVVVPGTHDVDPAWTYTNWATAATQIQWAVNVAVTGGTVLVSNGTYNLTNQISILKNITVRSLNGANFTFVNGNYPAYTNRCFYITNGVLDGFTISNGYFTGSATNGGGGIYIYMIGSVYNCIIRQNYCSNDNIISGGGGIYMHKGGIVSNCTVLSNTVYVGALAASENRSGGGIYMNWCYNNATVINSRVSGNVAYRGGGMYQYVGGIVTNCIIDNNLATDDFGGIYLLNPSARADNCVISNNTALDYYGGGRVYQGRLNNSIVIGNIAGNQCGGIGVYNGVVSNCQVIFNVASNAGGGILFDGSSGITIVNNCIIANNISSGSWAGVYMQYSGVMKNCLIYGNTNLYDGGGGVRLNNIIPYCTNYPYGMINCTIANNKTGTKGGGIYATGTNNYIGNCIIYDNVSTNDDYDEIYNDTAANTNNYWYTCVRTTPAAANTTLAPNQGNITNNPLFVDGANRNYRLNTASLCINAGTNQSWMTSAVDLDGHRRLDKFSGIVDMGCFENIPSGTMITIP